MHQFAVGQLHSPALVGTAVAFTSAESYQTPDHTPQWMSDGSHSRFHRVPAMTASPAAQTEDRTEELWVRYRSAGDAEARAQLLVRHLGLVHHVAREVSRRIPSFASQSGR